MGIKNKIVNGYAYFLTMTVVNWIDVKAEIVENDHEHLYSSAKNYAGEKGLLNVVLV